MMTTIKKGDLVKPSAIALYVHPEHFTEDRVYVVSYVVHTSIIVVDDKTHSCSWSEDRFIVLTLEEALVLTLKVT